MNISDITSGTPPVGVQLDHNEIPINIIIGQNAKSIINEVPSIIATNNNSNIHLNQIIIKKNIEPSIKRKKSNTAETMAKKVKSDELNSIETNNAYETLSDLTEDETDTVMNNWRIQQRKKRRNTATTSGITAPTNNLKKDNALTKMPAIIAYNIINKSLVEALNIILKNSKYNIKMINKNRSHIYTFNIDDFHKVNEYLKSKEINGFTYTPHEIKPINLIIKGLDNSFSNDEIMEELKTFNLENVDVKKNIINLKNGRTGELTTHRILQVSARSDIKALLNIEFILHQRIYWERLKSTISQCHNCQRFGHAASNCNMPYRCIKCTTNHKYGECRRPQAIQEAETTNDQTAIDEIKKAVACVNCGLTGHPANSKYCEIYKKFVAKKNKNVSEQTFKKSAYNTFVNSNQSYANMIRTPTTLSRSSPPQPPSQYLPPYNESNYPEPRRRTTTNTANARHNLPNPTTKENAFSFLQNECNSLFGADMFVILEKIQNFLPIYQNGKSIVQKKSLLISFLIELSALSP